MVGTGEYLKRSDNLLSLRVLCDLIHIHTSVSPALVQPDTNVHCSVQHGHLPGKHRSKSITMIIQDMLATADMDNKVIVTSELVAKINCLIILMGVIFTLLCILLTGCLVM